MEDGTADKEGNKEQWEIDGQRGQEERMLVKIEQVDNVVCVQRCQPQAIFQYY